MGTKPEDFHFDKKPRVCYPPWEALQDQAPGRAELLKRRKGLSGRHRREGKRVVGWEQEKEAKDGFSVSKRGSLPLIQEGRRGAPKRNMQKDPETSPRAGKETQSIQLRMRDVEKG